MFIIFEDRPSDSPFVDRVWRSHSERGDMFSSIASCTWEMVVSKVEGKTSMIIRGPETRATDFECPPEGEWFGVRFKLGTYMPLFLPGDLRDHRNAILPNASGHSFWLQGSAWELPTFENAETFVARLVRRGLLRSDPTIRDLGSGEPNDRSVRTDQRRFLRTTGLTRSAANQIERARKATHLLKQGRAILDVVFETGYYDQAHLTRSLKHYIGHTPAQVIREEHQLSLLYNTDAN